MEPLPDAYHHIHHQILRMNNEELLAYEKYVGEEEQNYRTIHVAVNRSGLRLAEHCAYPTITGGRCQLHPSTCPWTSHALWRESVPVNHRDCSPCGCDERYLELSCTTCTAARRTYLAMPKLYYRVYPDRSFRRTSIAQARAGDLDYCSLCLEHPSSAIF